MSEETELSSQEKLDRQHMARAIEIAAKGSYHTYPNPLVGCVIARGDLVLAEGYHKQFGGLHAEREAFAALDPKQSLDGASLYVNLEPCAHHGQTPPCIDAVLQSGIKRVVVAQRDPNPKVDGRSLEQLTKNGVELVTGVLEKEARELNVAFNKFMMTTRPFVIAKWAMSLDGKIAARGGDSKWITGEDARHRVHEIRGHCDAIVVGIGTALKDNPRLTRRGVEGRDPARVVVDSTARIPEELGLVATARDHQTFLVTTNLADPDRLKRLRSLGVNVIKVAFEGQRVDVNDMLDQFGRRGWQRILVEGGGALLGSFFAHDLVDRVHCFIAPKIIGGDKAPSPAGGTGVSAVSDALLCSPMKTEALGQDVLLTTDIHEW
ncbi:MAG: bifunctional diaminohydroxyphosphoribosylaminopyrimidine deaminase/5-amino-6-(5-phosphoribosylamino)uracil reductase RibD [Planctomycetota bacterium]|nr:bifunctional diaminohydroxyphosphoribosylaminopyrimidine deaminase/5-amino-6-(5-phosphoribosylamino)uracil reductase RibD [Planctomycetota bacterium]